MSQAASIASRSNPASSASAVDSRLWPLATGIAILIAAYVYSNLTFALVPGNNPANPLGWWAWDDQKEYLAGAEAFLRGEFGSAQHLYPPLYPLIGAIFLPLGRENPFFWPDLAFELGFFALFVSLFRRTLGDWGAVACGFLGMLAYPEFRVLWLLPLTTTPAACFFMALLFLFDRGRRLGSEGTAQTRIGNAALFGLTLGLLGADRPVDLAVTSPISIAYAIMALMAAGRVKIGETIGVAAAGVFSFAGPIVGYFVFNLASSGALFGRYFNVNSQMGFDPASLPKQFFSHWLASGPFFFETHADWASVIPLALLALTILPAALLWGPLVYRLAAACGMLQFLIYYCDHDILPTGAFRFGNVHYFKWLIPVAFALAANAVRAALTSEPGLMLRGRLALTSAAALALAGSSLTAIAVTAPAALVADEGRELRLTQPDRPIDYVDVPGVSGKWSAIYFARDEAVQIDGAALRPVSDFRFLPTESGFRILFMKPVAGHALTIRLAEGMTAGPSASIQPMAARVRFALVTPRFLQNLF